MFAPEELERRVLLSGFTPAQIDQAYGINQISFNGTAGDGTGQTIAIVIPYLNPSIYQDAHQFGQDFSIPINASGQPQTTGAPTLTVLNENGGGDLSSVGEIQSWDDEEALDVEWAHAVAPKANIVLFAAKSSGETDLFTANQSAAIYNGAGGNVGVISNSWSEAEPSSASTEQSDDSLYFGQPPAPHQAVTFLASAGDNGATNNTYSAAHTGYPSMSPNVISVGGTSLSLNGSGAYGSETAWSYNASNNLGGGGGLSAHESEPSFQSQMGADNGMGSLNGTAQRATPDVSMDADPGTVSNPAGMDVVDYATANSLHGGQSLFSLGGTSFGSPIWAGLIAIADQGRALRSLGTLDTGAALSDLYSAPPSSFHDIASGNNGYSAITGYDLASGRGSPVANLLVPYLAGYPVGTHLALASPPAITIAAGTSALPTLTVDIKDASGNIINSDNSAVTLAVYDSAATGVTLGGGAVTVNAASGVSTFSNLWITTPPNRAGTYQLVATDGSDVAAPFNFTVVPAEASRAGAVSGSSLGTLTGASPSPSGGLTLAGGALYGTTQQGGTATAGSVYEVSNGALTSLYSFTGGSGGSDPNGSVVIDSAGDIWGTTYSGGNINQITFTPDGTVFELSPSGTLIQSIPLSYSSTGSNPVGGLVMDAAGDMFGVTQNGGTAGAGTIFEINRGSSTISHVISLDGNGQGANPLGGLAMDASGNLYGTTSFGSFSYSTNNGTLFEVKNASTTFPIGTASLTTLAVFNGSSQGGSPRSTMALDAAGNVFGTTYSGGSAGYGTLFEFNPGTDLLLPLASFNSSASPFYGANVVLDANDNVYGTTENGGTYNGGTVFQLPAGSNTVSTIFSLGDGLGLGSTPLTGLALDAEGNLYGTTSASGVVFKLSAVALPGWLKPGSAGVWNGSRLTVNTPPGSGSSASVNFGEAIVIQDPDASPFADVPNVNVSQAPGTIAHVQFQATPGSSFSSPNPIHVGNLDLENGSTAAIITTSTADTLQLIVTGLTIDTAHDSQFDMANDRMLIDYGSGTDPLNSTTDRSGNSSQWIQSLLASGYNGGAWNGPGIVSSAAAAVYQANLNNPRPAPLTAIGYADAADGTGIDTMGANTIELAYVLAGDANLSDNVNSADLQILLYNFNNLNRSWDTGDFNYDTICNSADQQIVLFNFNVTGP